MADNKDATKVEQGSNHSQFEKWLFAFAVTAFLVLSVIFLGSVLTAQDTRSAVWRACLGVFCVFVAAGWYTISPSNQGRMMRQFIPNLPKPLNVADIEVLQRTVGSAGFFNRIGLTGIPLAVALLACVLYLLVLVATRMQYDEAAKSFMELAKLTTGAFIGALSTSRRAT